MFARGCPLLCRGGQGRTERSVSGPGAGVFVHVTGSVQQMEAARHACDPCSLHLQRKQQQRHMMACHREEATLLGEQAGSKCVLVVVKEACLPAECEIAVLLSLGTTSDRADEAAGSSRMWNFFYGWMIAGA